MRVGFRLQMIPMFGTLHRSRRRVEHKLPVPATRPQTTLVTLRGASMFPLNAASTSNMACMIANTFVSGVCINSNACGVAAFTSIYIIGDPETRRSGSIEYLHGSKYPFSLFPASTRSPRALRIPSNAGEPPRRKQTYHFPTFDIQHYRACSVEGHWGFFSAWSAR